MASTKEFKYTVGEPISIDSLRGSRAPRVKSARDLALEEAVKRAADASDKQAIPFHLAPSDKAPTIRLAASRIVARMTRDGDIRVPVHVGYREKFGPDGQRVLFLSRGKLRGGSKG